MGSVEIIPNVYQLTIRGVNITVIAEEELTLIDTGFRGSSPRVINFIHSLGRSVREISLILITHHHPDHIGSLVEFRKFAPQAEVAIHEADLSLDSQLLLPKVIRTVLHFPLFSALEPLLNPKLGEVTLKLKGGEVLRPLGTLKVIHTPGHTPGSISLFSPQRKLLIVGDTINSRYRNLRLPPKSVSSSLSQAINSIAALAQLDFEILCCGHGKPLTQDAKAKVQKLIKEHHP